MRAAFGALALLVVASLPLDAQLAPTVSDPGAVNAVLEGMARARVRAPAGTAEVAGARFGAEGMSYTRVVRWRPAGPAALAPPPSPVLFGDAMRVEVRRPVTRLEGALRGARLGPFSALARAAVQGAVCAFGGACDLDAGGIARMALVSSSVGAITGAILGPSRDTRWVTVYARPASAGP